MRTYRYGIIWLVIMLHLCVVLTVQAQGNAPYPTRAWTVSTPAAQGMDATKLETANQVIRNSLPHVHSLVVVRHGYIVAEYYYGGYKQNTRHAAMSLTKSVMAALVGVASDRGFINIDQPVAAYMPEYFPAGIDGRAMGITARHLLMLRSGINWMEYPPYSTEARTVISNPGYPIALGMAANPGDQWRYSTGDYHVLSGLLTRTTGMRTADFANAVLFGPLGITNKRWTTDNTGVALGGVGLYMTPRDMAKFGLLYLRNGVWDGQQLLTPGWVNLNMFAQAGNEPTPYQPGYGYGWWVIDLHGQRMAYAGGYGAQFIWVIPSKDMVVVMTGNENADPSSSSANTYQSLQIVNTYVIPAVID